MIGEADVRKFDRHPQPNPDTLLPALPGGPFVILTTCGRAGGVSPAARTCRRRAFDGRLLTQKEADEVVPVSETGG